MSQSKSTLERTASLCDPGHVGRRATDPVAMYARCCDLLLALRGRRDFDLRRFTLRIPPRRHRIPNGQNEAAWEPCGCISSDRSLVEPSPRWSTNSKTDRTSSRIDEWHPTRRLVRTIRTIMSGWTLSGAIFLRPAGRRMPRTPCFAASLFSRTLRGVNEPRSDA